MRKNDLTALDAALQRRFRVQEWAREIGGRTISILQPENSEDLIDEAEFERDERLPYWADVWPSARILAERIASMNGADRSLLELGCGAGLVSVCAAIAGFRVVASDYYDDAIRFARVNAHRNGVDVAGLLLDWRHLPPKLRRFDLVVASDVLYEQPYGELVARAIDATLSKKGTAIVADPGRIAREAFVQALSTRGLTTARKLDFPFVDGPIRQTISVFEIRRM